MIEQLLQEGSSARRSDVVRVRGPGLPGALLDQSVAAPEDEEAEADDQIDHHAPRQVPLRDRDERQPRTVEVCKVPAGVCEVGDRQEQRPESRPSSAAIAKTGDVELDELVAIRAADAITSVISGRRTTSRWRAEACRIRSSASYRSGKDTSSSSRAVTVMSGSIWSGSSCDPSAAADPALARARASRQARRGRERRHQRRLCSSRNARVVEGMWRRAGCHRSARALRWCGARARGGARRRCGTQRAPPRMVLALSVA